MIVLKRGFVILVIIFSPPAAGPFCGCLFRVAINTDSCVPPLADASPTCKPCRMGTRLQRMKAWAKALKRDAVALWIAARDPRTPWYAKAAAAAVAAYALSPLDLIPDFVPILGYVDDLLIVPLGIALAIRLIPGDLMAEYRAEADLRQTRPQSLSGAIVIVVLWLLALSATAYWLYAIFR